ncbi:MAG: TlpA family protein disulfide reductase [Phycisphaerales bacterium]|nr:TlpA family protein disulfide reductase [Phycisphaerales bacterium]
MVSSARLHLLAPLAALLVLVAGCRTPGTARRLTSEEQVSPVSLEIGDPAPWAGVHDWAKGDPIDSFRSGTVYVLDFWATWCGPCLASMPHVSELQRRYEPSVAVIAVAVVDEVSTPERIRREVRRRGARMDLAVAIDADGTATERYRVAVRDMALPRVFVVDRSGRLAWYGHPQDLDGVLAAVTAGTWNIHAAAEASRRRREAAVATRELLARLDAAAERRDTATMLSVCEELCEYPVDLVEGFSPPWWAWTQHVVLLENDGRSGDAVAVIEEAAKEPTISRSPVALAQLARLAAPMNLNLATTLAEQSLDRLRAIEAATGEDEWTAYLRDASTLEHATALLDLAAVEAAAGRFGRAAEFQRAAIARWPDDDMVVPSLAELRRDLERYEAGAGAS